MLILSAGTAHAGMHARPTCLVSCSTDPHQRARGAHDSNTLEGSVAESVNFRSLALGTQHNHLWVWAALQLLQALCQLPELARLSSITPGILHSSLHVDLAVPFHLSSVKMPRAASSSAIQKDFQYESHLQRLLAWFMQLVLTTFEGLQVCAQTSACPAQCAQLLLAPL